MSSELVQVEHQHLTGWGLWQSQHKGQEAFYYKQSHQKKNKMLSALLLFISNMA